MGLDITHYKIIEDYSQLHPSTISLVEKEGFDQYEVSADYFDPYWSWVNKYSRESSVKYATERDALSKVEDFWSNINPIIEVRFLNESLLNEYLNSLNQRVETLNQLYFLRKESFWYSLDFYSFQFVQGFYTREVGYQRKGVVDDFFKYFDYKITGASRYTSQERFELVYKMIGKYYDHDTNEDVIQLKKQFKRDFLDNYEKGKSILSVSY